MTRKLKLLRYEVQRVIMTKPYLLLSLITIVYGVFTLQTQTLHGIYGTAPFSMWSFIVYLLTLLPVFCTTALVYIAKTNDSSEKLVQNLTRSTPTTASKQLFNKICAISLGFVLQLIIALVAIYIFYALKFKVFASLDLLLYALIIAIPQLFFIIGIGLMLAQIKAGAVYGLAALLFFANAIQISLPMIIDIFGNSWLSFAQEAVLIDGEIAATIPLNYVISRIMICCVGFLLTWLACYKANEPSLKE